MGIYITVDTNDGTTTEDYSGISNTGTYMR